MLAITQDNLVAVEEGSAVAARVVMVSVEEEAIIVEIEEITEDEDADEAASIVAVVAEVASRIKVDKGPKPLVASNDRALKDSR